MNYSFLKTTVLAAVVIFLFSCKSNKSGAVAESPNFLTKSSDYIFDQSRLHTFEINLPVENLATLDADPAAEEFVEANLVFEGDNIGAVGLRYKGSIGSFVRCLSGTDWTNPSGYKTCTKISMKVKVDWKGSPNLFYGLKKLQFHSMNHDKSQMRDRLGYLMFSEMGVPSPRSVHARLVINGQYVGLFALIEQIDDRFAADRFEDYKGNIYKEVWPLDQDGNPTDKASIIEKADAYDGSEPDISIFQEIASEISATGIGQMKEVLPKWMNLDEIISYAAVDRTLRADDGPFHWYCFGGVCKPHNFFWYEKPNSRTLHLLPWDMDNAFQNIAEDRNPVTPIADAWGQITAGCEPFPYGPYKILQRSAACDKLTAGWVQYYELYQQKRAKLMAGPFSEANVNRLIDEWSKKIRTATIEAHEAHDDAVTEEQWEKAITQLKDDIRIAHERYQIVQGI